MDRRTRDRWVQRAIGWGLGVVLCLMAAAMVTAAWRLAFPRPVPPAAPVYVCVYLTTKDATQVTGPDPCHPPTGGVG